MSKPESRPFGKRNPLPLAMQDSKPRTSNLMEFVMTVKTRLKAGRGPAMDPNG